MKKLLSVVLALLLLAASVYAETESLLSSSTCRLFTNATDWVIKPNIMFNTLNEDFVIALGDLGLDTGTSSNGSAELGYYRHGPYPFALSAKAFVDSTSYGSKESGGSTENYDTLYWNFLTRATVGIPNAMDLSLGLILAANGTKTQIFDQWTLALSVPFGMQIGPVYNYAHPYFIYTSPNKKGTFNEGDAESYNVCLYDKVTFMSLIPGGVESNAWLALGLTEFSVDNMPLIETPAVPSYSTMGLINGQVGLANRYDFSPVDSLKLIINPKAYLDWYYYSTGFEIGTTVGSDAGIYYRPNNSSFGFFFAMTPCLQFKYQKLDSGFQDTEFFTTILWSGRLGITLFLPKDFTLDIACNVNAQDNPLAIKVQMAFTL